MQRDTESLAHGGFDVVIVGAGITGAFAAWDAAQRGLRTALIDRADPGSGASSNSLRIVHGGLRYVKRMELGIARTAIRERRTMLRIAPHLVEPLPILVPAHGHGVQRRTAVRALLAASDAAAWDRNDGVQPELRLPSARMLSREEVLAHAPFLADAGITGGALFHDARITHPDRLLFDVLRAAEQAGARIAGRVELEGALLRGGRVVGARLIDRLTSARFDVTTHAIVNATGGAAGDVMRRMLNRQPARLPAWSLALNVLLATPAESTVPVALADARGRQLLRVPWQQGVLLGTAHFPAHAGAQPAEEHVAALLEAHRHGRGDPARIEDVIMVQAGLLPLAEGATEPDRLMRRHRIIDHADEGATGAYTVLSVKYTTARLAAEHAIDALLRRAGRTLPCRTAITLLPSAGSPSAGVPRAAEVQHGDRVARGVLHHLVSRYGTRYGEVLDIAAERIEWLERVHPDSPTIVAELVHAVRHEMALTAEDLVWRRTALGTAGLADDTALARARSIIHDELDTEPASHPDAGGPPFARDWRRRGGSAGRAE